MEEKAKIYNKGVKEGIKHSKASPETIKMFSKMTEEIKNIEITQAEQGKDISFIKDNVAKAVKHIEDADTKYIHNKEFNDYKCRNDENIRDVRKSINKLFWTAFTTVLGLIVWAGKMFIDFILTKLN